MESAEALAGREPAPDRELIFRNDSHPEAAANRHLLERYLLRAPEPGRNALVVGHRPPMDPLGGIAEGETIVFRAAQGTLQLLARIPADNWRLALVDPDLLGRPASGPQATRKSGGRWYAPPRERYPEPDPSMLLDPAR
jgi:hypothetical protein